MDKEACIESMRKQFKHLTAEDFAITWKKYDADGNGFIEGDELRCFFKDFVMQSSQVEEAVSSTMLKETIDTYLAAYDEDNDGRIGMAELAEILEPEENFMLILQAQSEERSRAEFEKIWNKYDDDGNGYIDTTELKGFLQDMFPAGKKVPEAKLEKYTSALLKMLDSNNDKKLERKEMEKFLSIKD